MINYDYLMNIKYKNYYFVIVCIILIIILLILSCFLQTYSSYYTLGIYNDGLIVSVPISNSDAVKYGDCLTINQQKYKYKVKSISPLQSNGDTNYQEYQIYVEKDFLLNEVVDITFYYDKNTIIKKIMEIIF